VAQAKTRLGLGATAPVVSGDAAGRDGFWWHRWLQAHGSANSMVDASALAGNRRKRRVKSDGLDVRKLLSMLMRYAQGERQVWQVVKVPSVEAEDQRHLVGSKYSNSAAQEQLRPHHRCLFRSNSRQPVKASIHRAFPLVFS
jgi:hypothetical protein